MRYVKGERWYLQSRLKESASGFYFEAGIGNRSRFGRSLLDFRNETHIHERQKYGSCDTGCTTPVVPERFQEVPRGRLRVVGFFFFFFFF